MFDCFRPRSKSGASESRVNDAWNEGGVPRISNRARENLTFFSPASEGHAAYGRNKYSATNPGGIVNLALAENRLMHAEVCEKMNSGIFRVDQEHLPYGDMTGSGEIKSAIASLFNRKLNPHSPVEPRHVVTGNGATTMISAIGQIVCDDGESILIPAPAYQSFQRDFVMLSRVNLVYVTGLDGLPSVEQLDDAYKSSPTPAKALLICNPNNPTGQLIPPGVIRAWLKWAKMRGIHIIADEVYMFSVWDDGKEFESVLSLNEYDPESMHIIWSLSKDFCMSGMRGAAIISKNSDVLAAYDKIAYYHCLPRSFDVALARMLSDSAWVDAFIETNNARLRGNFTKAMRLLDSSKVPYTRPDAGLFLWIDLSCCIPMDTSDKTEAVMGLFRRLLKKGVFIMPGNCFFADQDLMGQTGRFRMIVSSPWEQVQLALERLSEVVHDSRSEWVL
ncbi:pyridoxal phosphate-dependent transferase [Chytriomyces sp. MP71]|nr:pyridoxal phosphate-dependent transferase [Chytriomyces sp. MP71]